MRPAPRLLHPLPPLPPRAKWPKAFPTNNFHIVNRLSAPTATAIGRGKRTQVADAALAASVVRALDVNKQDVILEAYPGLGFITRALLALPAERHPRKIITVEPAVDFNVKGLGLCSHSALDGWSLEEENDRAKRELLHKRMEESERAKQVMISSRAAQMRNKMHDLLVQAQQQADTQSMLEHPPVDEHSPPDDDASDSPAVMPTPEDHIFRAFPSVDEPSLTIIDGTMFDWKTVPQLESQGLLSDVQKRAWTDGEPPLHSPHAPHPLTPYSHATQTRPTCTLSPRSRIPTWANSSSRSGSDASPIDHGYSAGDG